jgi:hypothetical protein
MGAQEDRAGQVHDLGLVPDERLVDAVAGQAEPEARVAGQRYRGNADDGVGERTGIPRVAQRLCFSRRPGRDDERVMTLLGEEFGHSQDAVCDAVDVGRERLGNDRDPHGHKVRYELIVASQPP